VPIPKPVNNVDQCYAICQTSWDESEDKAMSRKSDAIYKQLTNAVDIKAIDENEYIVPFLASVKSVDRDDDLIDIDTMITAEFERNPVVPWAHNRSSPPVGKVVKIKKTKTYLKVWIKFAVEEDEFAAKIFNMVKGGYLNAVSIGFMPSWEDIERPKDMKLSGRKVERIYKNVELYEISIVPVPANRDALRTAKAFGHEDLSQDDYKFLNDAIKDEPDAAKEKIAELEA